MKLALHRGAPTLIAGAIALAYVVISPPSYDLSAHLFRARLFSIEGFGLWDNWWYAGHHIPGYSVLFPAVAAAVTPQVAAALAATATANMKPKANACWVSAPVCKTTLPSSEN